MITDQVKSGEAAAVVTVSTGMAEDERLLEESTQAIH